MTITELMIAGKLIREFTERTKGMDDEVFLAIVAILLEERCKATRQDVREMGKVLFNSIIEINQ